MRDREELAEDWTLKPKNRLRRTGRITSFSTRAPKQVRNSGNYCIDGKRLLQGVGRYKWQRMWNDGQQKLSTI